MRCLYQFLLNQIKFSWVHLYFARAKHSGRQFISENQRFTAGMLRPYEYICKNEMHPFSFSSLSFFPLPSAPSAPSVVKSLLSYLKLQNCPPFSKLSRKSSATLHHFCLISASSGLSVNVRPCNSGYLL